MEMDAEWEGQLDAIADDIHAALERDARDGHGGAPGVCGPSVSRRWMDALMDILACRQRENDADGASEVLDVLATLLKASATVDGTRPTGGRDGEVGRTGIFSEVRMMQIVAALRWLIVVPACRDERDAARALVVEVVSSLLLIASHEKDVEAVVEVMRESVVGTELELALVAGGSPPSSDPWAACYLRFVVSLIRAGETSRDDRNSATNLSTLNKLAGWESGLSAWIDDVWEKKWNLHRAAQIQHALFGSVEHCVASVRDALQGFSIGHADPAVEASSSEAAVVMALRDAPERLGLLHGVDITLIKDGQVHPRWSDSAEIVRIHDVDEALAKGYTVGVRGMHARSFPVFQLCNQLQSELGQHVNTNLYWTPPGQQGFELHIDDHCVFVLQLKGRKRWVLHKPAEQLPLLYDDTVSLLNRSDAEVDTELYVEEGDVLYVPRGVAHFADTRGIETESIHLTIGMEIEDTHTVAQVLRELGEAAGNTPSECERQMRRGLMLWHLSDLHALRNLFPSIAAHQLEHKDIKTVELLEAAREKLLREQTLFLERRTRVARSYALLHEALRQTPSLGSTPKVQAVDNDSDSRPTKKRKP